MSQRSIVTDKLEIYSKLVSFQFVGTQRLYFCKDVTVIDITTFFRVVIPELLMVVYTDLSVAKLCQYAQEHIDAKKPVLFGKIEKVNNKRERHEITCSDGLFLMDGDQYNFNKVFARAELEKTVPERLIIEY